MSAPAELLERLHGRRVLAAVSGGKDSAALSLHLAELGIEHERIFMDTGWENAATYDYLSGELPRVIGPIRWLRGPPGGMVELVRKKGTFPSRMRRFCTEELKLFPLRDYIATLPDDAVNAVGIRAAESAARAAMPEWEWSEGLDAETWRPLLGWTEEEVIAIHRRHGLAPNPNYLRGATRVGCWPCIFARKEEVRLVAETDPGRIALIDELERELAIKARDSWRRRAATWAALPVNDRINARGAGGFLERWIPRPFVAPAYFHGKVRRNGLEQIGEVAAWATTDTGGRQFQLFRAEPEAGCVRWGLCEGS